jgi:hypothetical protein
LFWKADKDVAIDLLLTGRLSDSSQRTPDVVQRHF